MARHTAKEMTVEEFEDWCRAADQFEKVVKAADEEGGPRLSLVPAGDQDCASPTDLLAAPTGEQNAAATPLDGIALDDSRKRLAGWSAERQRHFLSHLAESGSVHLACNAARLSARGAYRLRARSPAFARGWDIAVQLSVGRLSAIALDRAIHGRVEQVYHGGELVGERLVPNDKLLMWLLSRLDPRRFALPWEQRGDADPQAEAAAQFEGALDALTDTPA